MPNLSNSYIFIFFHSVVRSKINIFKDALYYNQDNYFEVSYFNNNKRVLKSKIFYGAIKMLRKPLKIEHVLILWEACILRIILVMQS